MLGLNCKTQPIVSRAEGVSLIFWLFDRGCLEFFLGVLAKDTPGAGVNIGCLEHQPGLYADILQSWARCTLSCASKCCFGGPVRRLMMSRSSISSPSSSSILRRLKLSLD